MNQQAAQVGGGLFYGYCAGPFYDEMFADNGRPRSRYARLFERLGVMAPAQFEERRIWCPVRLRVPRPGKRRSSGGRRRTQGWRLCFLAAAGLALTPGAANR
jgi:hypothetical protein